MKPSPTQCGEKFQGKTAPPTGADCILGPPGICIISNKNYPVYICNGLRNCSKRTFLNGLPFVLPISLQHFAAEGLITEINQLPSTLTIETATYELVCCTMFGNGHYNGCIRCNGTKAHYDGLLESKTPCSAFLLGSDLKKRGSGYSANIITVKLL